MARTYIDMRMGGEGWAGWVFHKWGNAKEWRLTAPTGENYGPGELLEARQAILNYEWLKAEYEVLTHPQRKRGFTDRQRATVIEAMTLLAEHADPAVLNAALGTLFKTMA